MTNSQPGLAEPFPMQMVDITVECEIHGTQIAQRIRSIDGHNYPIGPAPTCPICCEERRERKERERKEAEHRDRIARRIEKANIPRRFEGKAFQDFRTNLPEQVQAREKAEKFVYAVTSGNHSGDWLGMVGACGVGKTLLACAMSRAIAEHDIPVYYTTQSDMARDFRRSYQRDAETSEPELFDFFTTVSVLVIDEIGVSTTEHIERLLFEIFDARYSARLPTVFVTNHTRKDLADVIGERLYDRMCEVATFVSFNWPSVRASARRAAIDHATPTQRTA